jgi:hypothetical protein
MIELVYLGIGFGVGWVASFFAYYWFDKKYGYG